MSIRFDETEKRWILQTGRTTYQMQADKTGFLRHLYYGRNVGDADMGYRYRTCDRGFSGNPYDWQEDRGCSADIMPQEYSCYGTGDYRPSALMAEQENGSRDVSLLYDSFRIIPGKYALKGLPYVRGGEDSAETLQIILKDPAAGLAVTLSYGVFEEKDVITRSACITNISDAPVKITKAASLCLDLPFGAWDVIHFSGKHCMERIPERVALTQSKLVVESRRGMSSHHANPFVILCDRNTTQDDGDCLGGMLMYSGSHKEEVERDQTGNTRLVMGIHPDGFSWLLNPGEQFEAPETILSFSYSGLNGLSRQFHDLLRENVIPGRFMRRPRPILLNSWEACYFDYDREKLLRLAASAADLGMDMLVLDDGWFGSRNDDHSGLGDWVVNRTKIPGGLGELSEKIHDMGLKFGLWLEPEMINEDSDLYRAHPDWVLRDPGRKPVVARNQLVLDMGRQEVQEYLYDSIAKLLSDAQIEYLKWDFNRSLSDVYSNALPADRQGEAAHRFVLGTYALLERITTAFPDVLIEGCAGGGGRFDAGMLFYCPQIWCSDNTDPIARLKIHRGTSYGYPLCAMGSHVSASPNHQTGRETTLATRGIVAMTGIFGYELDPDKLSEMEKEEIREQIREYRISGGLVMNGTVYRLGEEGSSTPFHCWEIVSRDRNTLLVNLVFTEVTANAPFPCVKLKGLREDAVYHLEGTDLNVSGAALMYGGYVFENMSGTYPSRRLLFRVIP